MANENNLKEVITTSLESIKNLIDTNTVIGTPILANGTTIIPVSKVSAAHMAGGLDYAGKSDPNKDPKNSTAGGGAAVTMQPVGFLVVDGDGKVDMINIGVKAPSDPLEQVADILEKSPEIISKIKGLLGKD